MCTRTSLPWVSGARSDCQRGWPDRRGRRARRQGKVIRRAVAFPKDVRARRGWARSGGGAGIAADLRGFQAAGAFGCPALAVVTVQSTAGLISATPLAPKLLMAQVREVERARESVPSRPGRSARQGTSMRFGAGSTKGSTSPSSSTPCSSRRVARLACSTRARSSRFEPSSRGEPGHAQRAGGDRAHRHARREPRASGLGRARSLRDGRRRRAREGRAPARASGRGIDVLVFRGGSDVILLRSPRLALPPIHGGGCLLASLIAGKLAVGREARGVSRGALVAAVRWAKGVHRGALRRALDVGGPLRVLAT